MKRSFGIIDVFEKNICFSLFFRKIFICCSGPVIFFSGLSMISNGHSASSLFEFYCSLLSDLKMLRVYSGPFSLVFGLKSTLTIFNEIHCLKTVHSPGRCTGDYLVFSSVKSWNCLFHIIDANSTFNYILQYSKIH